MDILNLLGLKLKLIYDSNNYEPLKCFSMLYKRYKNVTMKNLSKTLLWPPDAKSQLIGKDSDTGKDWGQERRGWQRMRWLDGITDSMNEYEQTPGDGEWQESLVCYSFWAHSQTQVSNWTTTVKNQTSLGGPVVENPPTNTEGHGFDPWPWKIPHAAEQLSPCTQPLSPCSGARASQQEKPPQQSSPHSSQLERAHTQ